MNRRTSVMSACTFSGLVGLMFLALTTFWPAISGPFLLDDAIHFPRLEQVQSQEAGAFVFVFGHEHGLGRPLSFLSLLIEDNAWPTPALPYKKNNILFHCVNILLVFWLVYLLFNKTLTQSNEKKSILIAFFVAAAWGLHPMQLSPTMLTIQRMTLLAGTFCLLGLVFYVKARSGYEVNPKRGLLSYLLFMPLLTLISILFKEPGLLTPSLALVIEATVFRSNIHVKHLRIWRSVVVLYGITPVLLLVAYYFALSPKMDELYFKREFDMVERLLTQIRVLFDYLKLIVLPDISDLGPYRDDYTVSRSLFQPFSTLICLVFWLLLIGLSFFLLWKKNILWLAFGVVFFLVGHLVESSFLPIELYFEHRNYIPMLGILIGLSALVYHGLQSRGKVLIVLSALYLGFLIAITWFSAITWGSEQRLAVFWSTERPRSLRAQYEALKWFLFENDIENALKTLKNIDDQKLSDTASSAVLTFAIGECFEGTESLKKGVRSLDDILTKIKRGKFDHGVAASAKFLNQRIDDGKCNNVDYSDLEKIYLAALENEKLAGYGPANAEINIGLAELAKKEGRLDKFMYRMDLAYEAQQSFNFQLVQAYFLADAGLFSDSLCYLERAKTAKNDINKLAFIYKDKVVGRYKTGILARANQAGWQGLKDFDAASCEF